MAARIFSHLAPVSTGYGLMLIDGLVILLAGLVFKTPEIMLYAIIALAVTGKTIDLVMEGFNYSKGALIISDHAEAIAERVLKEFDSYRFERTWSLFGPWQRGFILCGRPGRNSPFKRVG